MFEQLVSNLTHADPTVRYEAATRLGASKDARAVQPLIDALPDANEKVQYAAMSGLIKLGDPLAASPIIEMLLREPQSRLWDLMKLGLGMRLRQGLLDLVQHGDTWMSDRVNDALMTSTLDEQQRVFLVRMLGRTGDLRFVEPLIDMLMRDTPAMQGAAAESLGYLRDERAIAPLMVYLHDPNDHMRETVIEALGRIGDDRAVEPLILALKDDVEWVRRAAASWLGDLGDRRAIEPLSVAMHDANEVVQDAAFEALQKLSVNRFNTMI